MRSARLGSTRRQPQVWRRPVSLAAGLGAGLLLFALLLPAVLTGWNGNIGHLQTWFSKVVTKVVDVRTSDFGEDVRTVRNQSLDNAAYRFGNFLSWQFAGGPDDTLIDHPHDASLRLPMDDPSAGALIVLGRILALADPVPVRGSSGFQERLVGTRNRIQPRVRGDSRGLPRGAGLLLRSLSSGDPVRLWKARLVGPAAEGRLLRLASRRLGVVTLRDAVSHRTHRSLGSRGDGLVSGQLRLARTAARHAHPSPKWTSQLHPKNRAEERETLVVAA